MTDNEIKNYITEKYNYFEMRIFITPISASSGVFYSMINVKNPNALAYIVRSQSIFLSTRYYQQHNFNRFSRTRFPHLRQPQN